MNPLTSQQYRGLTVIQRKLTEAGIHPSVAGRLVLRAMKRILSDRESGLGILQVRRVQRERTGVPRPRVAGERCVTIREIPGRETEIYPELDEYRARGWNILDVGRAPGYSSVKAYYACPPGHMPRENQPLILQSEVF